MNATFDLYSWGKDLYLGAPNCFDYVCTHFINAIKCYIIYVKHPL